jgi:hypothetical protein
MVYRSGPTAKFSRPLEGTRLIDREGVFLLPAAKIAPIQQVGWNDLLGAPDQS